MVQAAGQISGWLAGAVLHAALIGLLSQPSLAPDRQMGYGNAMF